MKKHLGIEDKKNEIRLLIGHPLYKDKVIVLVEGPSDVRLYRKLLANSSVHVDGVEGKAPLLRIVQDLLEETKGKLLGIRDADFEHLKDEKKDFSAISIYLTDHHDAELMILDSPALDAFLDEYTLPAYLNLFKKNLLTNCLAAGNKIGLLRWINDDLDLGFNFKNLAVAPFIQTQDAQIAIDVDAMIDTVLLRSPGHRWQSTREALLAIFHEYEARNADHLQVCCGHDISALLLAAFQQRHVAFNHKYSFEGVESSLRMAYRCDYFKRTSLYRGLSNFLGLDLDGTPTLDT